MRKRPNDFFVNWSCKVSDEELSDWEIYFIKKFNTLTPNGYNLTKGGEGCRGFCHSKETKEKLRNLNLGKSVSIETREKLSKLSKGKKVSIETRNKISNALKNKPLSEATKAKFLEIRNSPEYRLKMSIAIKKHWELRRNKQRISNEVIPEDVIV